MQLKNQNLFQEKSFINGKWINKSNHIAVFNPSTHEKIGDIANCDGSDALAAVDAAHTAFQQWSQLTGKQRCDILLKWHTLIIENQDDLATILTLEQGKPLAEARGEILYGASFTQWFAEEAKRVRSDVILAPKDNQQIITIKQAIGVVATITPWNFPSAMITRKASAAMAAGCSVVLKPSELTPFSALALAVLAKEAGIPDGVFNVITGDADSIGKEFCTNAYVKKLSFTGSTKIGKLLNQQCAHNLKKTSMELGGNAPFIIFDDADLDKAISGLIHAKFRNAGQACTCANRILVHASIHNQFLQQFLPEVQKLKAGDGFDSTSHLGPIINQQSVEKLERLINNALTLGAKLEIGGAAQNGTFFPATVLSNANHAMDIAKEEIFGPIAAIYSFTTDDEAIALANQTHYGLGSFFYTNNNSRIWKVAKALDYGMVAVNESSFATEVAPFGGVKDSGFGKEGSHLGIEEFLETKTLHLSF